mgnify:CR=1 FL=1
MISKINQLEIRHIRYFLVLAETLHFRKAAAKLLISQSALSQQINLLETILGVKLFDRTNRKVVLNAAGAIFLEESRFILNQLDNAMDRWQQALHGSSGQLKIGFVGSTMKHYLPPIIKKFTSDYPKVGLALEELTNSDQLKALEKDHIDIGFMRSNKVSSEMNIKSVYQENFSLVLPEHHPINESNFVFVNFFETQPPVLISLVGPVGGEFLKRLCRNFARGLVDHQVSPLFPSHERILHESP